MCRYRRLQGDRVYFLTGTDEHGDKIAQGRPRPAAPPQAYADEIAAAFRDTWRRLGITNDDFIRTTEPRHKVVRAGDPAEAPRRGRHLQRRVRGQVLFRLRAVLHRRSEIVDGNCPDPPDAAHVHQGAELLLPAVEVPGLADRAPRGASGLHPAGAPPERGAGRSCASGLQDLSISRARRGYSGASRCPSTTGT